jgi:cytoskeletal protein RodZ
MKRCPQCEFIYEDDQSLCDMDGILLVFDAQQLPEQEPTPSITSPKSRWRSRAVPAAATVILATVLFLVYYVSTQRHTTQVTADSPTTATGAESIRVPASSTEKLTVTGTEENRADKPPKVATTPTPSSAPAKSQPKPKAITPTQKSQTAVPTQTQQKDQQDSKLGSMLKKTGRLLKKPFKF